MKVAHASITNDVKVMNLNEECKDFRGRYLLYESSSDICKLIHYWGFRVSYGLEGAEMTRWNGEGRKKLHFLNRLKFKVIDTLYK